MSALPAQALTATIAERPGTWLVTASLAAAEATVITTTGRGIAARRGRPTPAQVAVTSASIVAAADTLPGTALSRKLEVFSAASAVVWRATCPRNAACRL